MPARGSIARGSARIATGVVGIAVASAALVGAALLPLPSFRVEPPSATVTPVPADQERVCPGPLLDISDASASSLTAFDSPNVVVAASTEVNHRALAAPDVSGGSGPEVISTQSGADASRPLISGAQSQSASQPDLTGFAAAACGEAAADSWLVAGSTTLGATSLVQIANPSPVQATVDLTVYTEGGEANAPGARGLVVRAHSQLVVPLSGLVPNAQASVVHVEATGGSVYATLQQSLVQGLAPQGTEVSGPTAQPDETQIIPGMVVANIARLTAGADGASTQLPAVRLLAPGKNPVHVTVHVTGEKTSGSDVSTNVTLQGGTVREVPFDRLLDGAYTVRVTADAPVVAAARTVDAGAAPATGDSATAQAEASTQDFAWFVACDPIEATAKLAVPSGKAPTLHLMNATDKDATATLEKSGSAARTIAVPAGEAVSMPLAAKGKYTLGGAAGLRASVAYTADAATSSFALSPPGPLAQPITVYPK